VKDAIPLGNCTSPVIKMRRSWVRRRGGGKTTGAKLFGAETDSIKMRITAALSGLMTSVIFTI